MPNMRIPRVDTAPPEPEWSPGATLPPPSASARVEEPGVTVIPPSEHLTIVIPPAAFAEPARPQFVDPEPPRFASPEPPRFVDPEPAPPAAPPPPPAAPVYATPEPPAPEPQQPMYAAAPPPAYTPPPAPPTAPSYETPTFETPTFEPPAYVTPSYETPAYQAPSSEVPSFAPPAQPAAPPPPAAEAPRTAPSLDDLYAPMTAPNVVPPAATGAPSVNNLYDLAAAPAPRAADRAEPAFPAAPVDDSIDERTTVSARRSRPTKFWTLDLPGGIVELIQGTVILGRQASAHPDFPGARLLSIDDPSRSVSKNHAVLTETQGQLYVEDLGSMNGVVVVRADGDTADLIPGRRVRLDNGATVELGDLVLRVTLH